jgi:mycothiol synthase
MDDAASWEVLRHLTDEEVAEVGLLVEQVTEADGVRPLSEHVMLHLRSGGDVDVRHVMARRSGRLVGYAHLDVTDLVSGASAELAVAPDSRRSGIGSTMVARLLAETVDGRLRLWAHGEQSAAAALAHALGFRRSRTLWQMRRSLSAALAEPLLPPGVRVRTFLPGLDDDDWVALNARAFADLPDQGRWTSRDLHLRMAEPWFDPAGFFLAEADRPEGGPRLVGFHWTKVHGSHEHEHGATGHEHVHLGTDPGGEHLHGHDPIGEVYVVGVDPDAHGQGLGRALTLVGLRHLRALGLLDVMLYVDAQNTSAIRLYESLGFARWDVDVEFTT